MGLTTLETRRLRSSLIQAFKIFKGYDDICEDIFFIWSKSNLRGYLLNLHKSVGLDIASVNILSVIKW